MKINRNMSAVVANRQLLRTENKLSISMGRLSSGYKINKAGDNPAGMAISSKMKAQIDGLDQAEANSDDGQSVLRIADGALNEVSNMLQRIRELSVQAANGTNSYSDRQSIQDEIDQLTQEVDRISTDTEYNKKTLLDGSTNTRVYVSGTQTADGTKFARSATRIDFSEEVLPGDYTVEVKTPATQATYQLDMSGLINDPNFDGGTVSINGVGIDYEKGMSADDVYKQLMSVADEIGCKIEKDPNNAGVYNITADNRGSKETLTIGMSEEMAQKTGLSNAQGVVQNADDKSYKLVASGTDAEIELKDGFGSTVITNVEGNRVKITDKGGFSMDFLLSDDIRSDACIRRDGCRCNDNSDRCKPVSEYGCTYSRSFLGESVSGYGECGGQRRCRQSHQHDGCSNCKTECDPLRNRCIHKSSGVRKFESGRDTGRYDNRVFGAYGYRYGI